MTAAGLIFSNIHDDAVSELTRMRTMASVPFGGRYRLIDFTLSNMVNAGISKVGIVTSNNYRSLLDHIGTGKDWDLARREDGIKILPPNITAYDSAVSADAAGTRLGALVGVINFIERCNEDVIVLSDCDTICNISVADVLAFHKEKEAQVTVVTKKIADAARLTFKNSIIRTEPDGRITDVFAFSAANFYRAEDISTNIMVIDREYLLKRLYDARARGYTSFFHDIMAKRMGFDRYFAYAFDGYYSFVNSIPGYYASSMDLLDPAIRGELFRTAARPIYTKVRNSAPTLYTDGCAVKNSMIADGCVIEGTVENSIVFRGAHIGKGSVVRNAVLMQDAYIGDNVNLNCVIADKNAVIRDGVSLAGHKAMPFFLGKGMMLS